MTRYPGEVYYLPPEAAADGDPKHRPHVLLSTCNDSAEIATLAYCSTQATDAAFGAAHVLVNPAATKYRLTGLREATYVYPSRLTNCGLEDLGDLSGRIIDEMPDIRLKLVQALGIGTGSCIGAGPAAASLRGSVVSLQAAVAEEIGTPYALVVTEPGYSLERRFLNVIPVYDGAEFDSAPSDIVVEDAGWVEDVGFTQAIIATSMVQSVFLPEQVESVMVCALDDDGMAAVDAGLREHLGLPTE